MSVATGHAPADLHGLVDSELVQLARDGNEFAFDVIVHRYRVPLVSYCRRWLDPHRAEEVVQHTFMKAFLCLRDDDRPLALRPWLYRVAHNAALNALEKKGGDWEELDENYDGVPQPPQVAEQRARFLQVVDEIGALPVRQREALLLNEFEGRCYAEIATELGTSESGVRGLLRRARRQLRDAAAVLVPIPAIRELFRSDASRSFQAERAGEIIGTAGAAGGLGAVGGGFVKVAAGVLAAGTIAGGGTAIEHRNEAWKTPSVQAAEPQPEASAVPSASTRDPGASSRRAEAGVATAARVAPGDLALPISSAPETSAPQGAFGGFVGVLEEEEESLADSGPLGDATPAPPVVAPVPNPPIGLAPPGEQEPAAAKEPPPETETGSGSGSEQKPSGHKQPGSGEKQSSPPAGGAEGNQRLPESAPASGPLPPLRG